MKVLEPETVIPRSHYRRFLHYRPQMTRQVQLRLDLPPGQAVKHPQGLVNLGLHLLLATLILPESVTGIPQKG
jgi:hypothetical protein